MVFSRHFSSVTPAHCLPCLSRLLDRGSSRVKASCEIRCLSGQEKRNLKIFTSTLPKAQKAGLAHWREERDRQRDLSVVSDKKT
ncbi:hypothetical protein MATL_G00097260 [Megalops atlanticus]|uniref:Uncharacterized protein n=1 Tax=Megalops atlanticus TaxID=7932 RepID=A0A9D3Q6K8_MEGAT|nr:hypothetical protein MATL_G00097260 [Megalops atlanticus]